MVVSFKKIVGIFIVDCWKKGGIIVSTAGLFDRTFCLVGCGRLCTVQYDLDVYFRGNYICLVWRLVDYLLVS